MKSPRSITHALSLIARTKLPNHAKKMRFGKNPSALTRETINGMINEMINGMINETINGMIFLGDGQYEEKRNRNSGIQKVNQ